MKILIVGGGIAGPALAIQLKKHNVSCEITLIEQAPEFKNIGYSVVLWGNGRNVLREIGIDNGVVEREGYEVPWEAFETLEHRLIQASPFEPFRRFGPMVSIPRAILHKTLIDQLDPASIRLNTKVKNIIKNTDEGVEVEFTDGTIASYDLLVGADGIHSATREQVWGPGLLKPYGSSLYLFWMPEGFQFSKGAVGIVSGGKMFFTYPGQNRAVVMLGTLRKPGVPDDPETRPARIAEFFKEFGPVVQDMIRQIPSGKDILFSDTSHVDMKDWYKSRVVLIGDARHALSPLTGMGASLALEDSCVLAQELARQSDVKGALKCFAERRGPRIKRFQRETKLLESWLMSSGLKARFRDFIGPHVSSKLFLKPIEELLKESF
jgi:FAD-dependent urate hydroxylase